jgi:hypothetical protein
MGTEKATTTDWSSKVNTFLTPGSSTVVSTRGARVVTDSLESSVVIRSPCD